MPYLTTMRHTATLIVLTHYSTALSLKLHSFKIAIPIITALTLLTLYSISVQSQLWTLTVTTVSYCHVKCSLCLEYLRIYLSHPPLFHILPCLHASYSCCTLFVLHISCTLDPGLTFIPLAVFCTLYMTVTTVKIYLST